MKKIYLVLALFSLLFTNCSKDKKTNENEKTTFELSFQVSDNTTLKSTTSNELDIVSALITIENSKGELIYNNEEVKIYHMNDSYISKPISVNVGDYKITRLLLLDSNGSIIYASPLKESALAYMVKKPLPISFSASTDVVYKLCPEVLSTTAYKPNDFGYSTFSFKIVNPLNFELAVFEYSESEKNFVLTDANINISTTDTFSYQTSLLPKTNFITVPEKNLRYSMVITKTGYKSFSKSFSVDSMKLFLKNPLEVILWKEGVNTSLVALYKFNGNAKDASEYENNGIINGTGTFVTGINAQPNTSLSFNGYSDYIKVKNTSSLNPTKAITVSAWIKPTDFVGAGSDAIVDKPYLNHASPYYQYHLATAGSYGGNLYSFGFNVAVNNNYIGVNSGAYSWQPNKWYLVTGTYDGINIKIYVNGILRNSVEAPGTISTFNTDLFIGKMGNVDYYLPCTLDEVRIYNTALTDLEIQTLYQNL